MAVTFRSQLASALFLNLKYFLELNVLQVNGALLERKKKSQDDVIQSPHNAGLLVKILTIDTPQLPQEGGLGGIFLNMTLYFPSPRFMNNHHIRPVKRGVDEYRKIESNKVASGELNLYGFTVH